MSPSESQKPQSYSTDDVQQILQLAIARQGDEDEEFSLTQIEEIAAELGIERDALVLAEQDWRNQQLVAQKRQAFDSHRRKKLQKKAAKYLIVNIFLVSLNLLSAGTLSWSLYILLIWGLGLALATWKTYQLEGEEYEQAYYRWERKVQIKRSFETLWDKLQKALPSFL